MPPLTGVHEHRPDDEGKHCRACGQAIYPLRFGVWLIWVSLETGQPCGRPK